MFGRSLASLLGFFGGACVAFAGLLDLILGTARSGGLGAIEAGGESILLALGLIVLGLVIIVVARPRFFWWGGRTVTTGLSLLVLGLVVWFLLGGGILLALGAVLTFLSGALFLVESIPHRSWF